jgi:hypothetical protein
LASGCPSLPAPFALTSRSGTDQMISYHIIASVSLAQREDLERQANRLRMVQEGRAVRKRTLRDARLRRNNLSPPRPHSWHSLHSWQSLPSATASAPPPIYPPGAGRLMPAALVLAALVLVALVLVQ